MVSSQSSSDTPIVEALRRLAREGWLPLRQVSVLLGHRHTTTIYGRQIGRNAIPTVKVGGVYRVCAEDVIKVLENMPERDHGAAVIILSKYRQLLAEYNSQHDDMEEDINE